MKAVLFVVADFVNIYEAGKLVIVGTFDMIKATDLPFRFRPFGVALKLEAGPHDCGKTYEAVVVLRKSQAPKRIMEAPIKIGFPKRTFKAVAPSAGVVMQMPALEFRSAGTYVLEFRVKSKLICETRFHVREVATESKTAAKKKPKAKRKPKAKKK